MFKLYEKPRNYQNFPKIKIEGDWGELEAKKLFPETFMDKIYEKNSSFHRK